MTHTVKDTLKNLLDLNRYSSPEEAQEHLSSSDGEFETLKEAQRDLASRFPFCIDSFHMERVHVTDGIQIELFFTPPEEPNSFPFGYELSHGTLYDYTIRDTVNNWALTDEECQFFAELFCMYEA
jgi:hypothetical protein